MTGSLPSDLGVALDEANWIGFEHQPEASAVALTFETLTLPADNSPPPDDRRRQLVLQPVGRIAASLRMGVWNDRSAPVLPLTLDSLPDAIASFGGLPVYGADTRFDASAQHLAEWGDRLSLDVHLAAEGHAHSLFLFQEGHERHLDICIWFDSLRVFDPAYTEISLEEFAAGAMRWWRGLHDGDSRTSGYGIFPLK